MTTQFEKNAVNFVRLGSQLSRAFKGLKSAPKDLISVATGKGMPTVAKELGRAGRLGNLAGHAAIATGAVLGTNKLLNGGSKDSKAPNRGRPISSGQHPLDLRMQEGLEAGRDAASRGLSKEEAIAEFMEKHRGMGGSGQGGAMPKGMRFDARPRDWNRMGGTGGMAGKTAVGIAERNKLQPYQLELMDNVKSSPRYDYTPDLDKQAGLNYNLNTTTTTTMTPFAQLEKRASEDDSTGRSIARHGINAATTTAGLGVGGLSTLLANLRLASAEAGKIQDRLGIPPRQQKGVGRFLEHGWSQIPKNKKMLTASLIPLLGALGYGAGRGINAGIDTQGNKLPN
jgi:hypothetical protein